MKLIGRTVLITGGSSGIGYELAKGLLARGNVVVVTGREQSALDEAARRLAGLHTVQSDVSDAESIRSLCQEITARFPKLDMLVNNAGIMRGLEIVDDRSLEDITREIDIDLTGPIRMIQQFIPHLLRQPNALIVNVSSGLAFVPFTSSPIYSAAKAGVHAYTRCLRVQLANTNVKVIELAPPLTETPLLHKELNGSGGMKGMAVNVLAKHAFAGIEAGKTEIRPGQSNILKIASRVAPGLIFNQLSKVGRPERMSVPAVSKTSTR